MQMIKKINSLAKVKYCNPFTAIEWPEHLIIDKPFFSFELLSIYETSYFAALTVAQKNKLSFYECVNFFSLNVAEENALIKAVSELRLKLSNQDIDDFIFHLIDEENKHIYWFSTFCQKYNRGLYKNTVIASAYKESSDLDAFIVFAKILIFEEVAVHYNSFISRDQSVDGLTRKINSLHLADEVRHLSAGAEVLSILRSRSWTSEQIALLENKLFSYFDSIWVRFCNSKMYSDAELKTPYLLAPEAIASLRSSKQYSAVKDKLEKTFSPLGVNLFNVHLNAD